MPPKKDPKKDAKGGKGGKLQPGKKPKDKPTSGGKAKKKKWSRVKQREQLNNMPLFDQATYEKVKKEVPFRYVTPSLLSDRFKIRLSLAKRTLRELEKENMLRIVTKHHAQIVYTRTSDAVPSKADGGTEKKSEKSKKGGKKGKKGTELDPEPMDW